MHAFQGKINVFMPKKQRGPGSVWKQGNAEIGILFCECNTETAGCRGGGNRGCSGRPLSMHFDQQIPYASINSGLIRNTVQKFTSVLR